MATSPPEKPGGDGLSPPPIKNAAGRSDATAVGPSKPKKHRAQVEHRVRGRIRMRIPHAKTDPEILETYRRAFLSIPGVRAISAKPETGSIVIHYDPNREPEFERQFARRSNEQLEMASLVRPDDEIDRLANKIEAEAEFLAAHSRLARTSVDFLKAFDRELKLSTGNMIDLKIVLAAGLAAYTFFEIGGNAATPMWVTLALFSLNHFAELQTDHRAELARAQASA